MPEAAALQQVLVIMGPTGSGKSDIAMRLAQELPVEIVSVDSAQVYRGMDIGTAKPTAAERAAVPHHLIDIRDPEQSYSAGEFRRDALSLIAAIAARGRLPLLVGGTMLYFRSLFHGIASLPQADAAVRARIDTRAQQEGWPALHAELATRDRQAAARIGVNDAQRIQRALEVLELRGRAITELWQEQGLTGTAQTFNYRVWQLLPGSRAELHARLERRLDAMLQAGVVAELQALLRREGLSVQSASLRAVGYRQLLAFCDGRETLLEARQKALSATRQLAKRQLTWLRSAAVRPVGAETQEIDPFEGNSSERIRADLLQWLYRQP
ncbi:MAG: tRNA (adenosine(37)-N6)-dimethylallyltransferase MiaA [Pseudomonadota bacterium]